MMKICCISEHNIYTIHILQKYDQLTSHVLKRSLNSILQVTQSQKKISLNENKVQNKYKALEFKSSLPKAKQSKA